MITYELSLERQNLLGADKFSIAADSNETVSLRFHFDRSWRAFSTKAAVFKSSADKYYVLDIHLNCVTVPWEVLRDTSGFDLAVVAYENEVVLTSKKVRINVSASLLPEFCRQLSPTETIFDRFRTEARNKAFEDYNSEITALNHTHANAVLELNARIAEEQANTEALRAQKDAEIAQLNYAATVAQNSHNAQIAEFQAQIALNAEKAHNWDLVDTALRAKTSFSNLLWTGGTQPYELPQLNLVSVQTNSNNTKIDSNVTKIRLNIPLMTNLNSFFSSLGNLKEVTLLNTEAVTSASSICSSCTSLISADLGNLTGCTSLRDAFNNSKSVEYISIGNLDNIKDFYRTFENCYALKEINGIINATQCTSFSSTFTSCSNLKEIRFVENSIRINIDVAPCVNLSRESLYSIANGLYGGTTGTLYISEHSLSTSLTPAERTEITNLIRNEKGWNMTIS